MDFARSLLDMLAEDIDSPPFQRVLAGIESLESDGLRRQLKALVDQGASDIERLRADIEKWFDSQMDSLSRWYRRRTRWVSFAIGVPVALVFNVNVLAVAQEMWENTAVREAAVAVATDQLSQELPELEKEAACGSADELLRCAEDKVGELVDAGLPIGWPCTNGTACDNAFIDNAWKQAWDGDFGARAYRVLGWLIAAAGFSAGASFWFDALKRVAGLRSKVTGG